MQFLDLSERDGQKMNTWLFEHKLGYSYKQLLAFILAVYWKQLLKSIAVQCGEAAEKYIHKNDFLLLVAKIRNVKWAVSLINAKCYYCLVSKSKTGSFF